MSGYLQRMAATAVMPQRRVHPFVQPMFGKASQQASEPASQPTVTERVSEATSQRVGETTRRVTGPVPPTVQDTAAKVERQASEAARRERYEPLMAEASGESVGNSPMVDFVERGAPAAASFPVHDAAAKAAASGPQRRERQRDGAAEKVWTFEPLMGEAVQEASGAGESFAHPTRDGGAVTKGAPVRVETAKDGAPTSAHPPDGEAVAKGIRRLMYPAPDGKSGMGEARGVGGLRSAAEMAAGRRLAQQQQARERAEHQGDDIQIHIGRIEVIAMPPAAPRPTPVPARKSQTLDEYLRRGSGRAG